MSVERFTFFLTFFSLKNFTEFFSAEITKLAVNCFLTTKIAFAYVHFLESLHSQARALL